MSRIGVRKLFPFRNRSLGSGNLVGSGNQLKKTRTIEMTTRGRAIYLIRVMLHRTKRPNPSSRDSAKPSTKIACHVNGLKNHCPSTGQVGAVNGTVSAAK